SVIKNGVNGLLVPPCDERSLAAAVPMALKTGYQLPWLETLKATAIPLAAAVTCLLLKTPWMLGVSLTLLSTLLYPKLGLITRADVAEASTALLPRRIVSAAYPYAKRMLDQIYGE
ncbi:MAG: hypothetical protein QXE22_07410, partial [Candidatus Bathyarchaeia archaeon]